MSAIVCPACRHPTRKHDPGGCIIDDCWCDQTKAMLGALDELPAPAAPVFVEPEPVTVPPPPQMLVDAQPVPSTRPHRTRSSTEEERFRLNVEALRGDLRAILRRINQQRREPTAEEREEIQHLQERIRFIKANGADAPFAAFTDSQARPVEKGECPSVVVSADAPDSGQPAGPGEDSPAGEDDDGLDDVAEPVGDLPGTDSAPDADGRGGPAEPIRGGDADLPVAEALTPVSATGTDELVQLLGSWVTWHCALHLVYVELPSAHDCPAGLIRARVTIRKEPADG